MKTCRDKKASLPQQKTGKKNDQFRLLKIDHCHPKSDWPLAE